MATAAPTFVRKSSALLLGTNFKIKASNSRAIARKGAAKSGDLRGILKDIDRIMSFLTEVKKIDIYSYMTGASVTKDVFLKNVKVFFGQRDVNEYIIYYSGHGIVDTGDWVIDRASNIDDEEVDDEKVDLSEILQLWDRHSKYNDTLLIVADCCYSGAWVEELNKQKRLNVFMNASCGAKEICHDDETGGYFTKRFIEGQNYAMKGIGWQEVGKYTALGLVNIPTLFAPTIVKAAMCRLSETDPVCTAKVDKGENLLFLGQPYKHKLESIPQYRVPGGLLLFGSSFEMPLTENWIL